MIQNRVYILVLVFVMLSLTVFAQGKKPDKDMDKALKYLNEKNYEKALEIYLQEYQAERLDKYALRIADMYHRLNQNEKSLQWFKDVKYLDKADKKYLLIFADVNKELGYLKPAFDYYMLYAIEANDAEGVYDDEAIDPNKNDAVVANELDTDLDEDTENELLTAFKTKLAVCAVVTKLAVFAFDANELLKA